MTSYSAVHTTARLRDAHDNWSTMTQSCSVWPRVNIRLSCCRALATIDGMTAGGCEPFIMHLPYSYVGTWQVLTTQSSEIDSKLSIGQYVVIMSL